MAKIKVDVILDGQGGQLARESFEAERDDVDDIDNKASEIIDGFILSVGDTIRIVEVNPADPA